MAPLIALMAHEAEVMGQDMPIRELEARWGITRNALKSRAAALGVELIRVSSTDTRWPAAFLELADDLHSHLQTGGTLKDFPGSKAALTGGTGSSAAGTAKGAITKASDAETMAAVISAVLAQTTSSLPASSDPLQRAKALADAADNGLVLTTDELVALGVKGVDGFSDGDLAYGYCFNKHSQRNRTLWTVERVIASRPISDGIATGVTAQKGDKRVGFDVAALIDFHPVRTGTALFAANMII